MHIGTPLYYNIYSSVLLCMKTKVQQSNLNFALSRSYLPATFLCSGLVCSAYFSLLPLEVLQLSLGLLQLQPGLHSFTLQCCDLVTVLPVQGLSILT